MKKKIYVLLIAVFLVFSASSCEKTTIDENEVEHPVFGRFITLSEEKYYDDVGAMRKYHYQYIAYDKDTKIMYVIDRGGPEISISPFYVMNSKNEPVIGVYDGDLEDIE